MGVTGKCFIPSKMELIGLSGVCQGFVTGIVIPKKSMITMILKHQNWVESLIGIKLANFQKNLRLNILCNKYF